MGVALLPAAAAPQPAARVAAPQSASTATGQNAPASKSGPVTVKGPQMYNPVTHKPFPQQSTVTVSQTSGLVNQLINVSWTNFTPSTPNGAAGPYYVYNSTYYAVMILECKGANPKSWTACYEYQFNGIPQADGTSGPPNAAFAITTGTGTGQAPVDVENSQENQVLGCDPKHPCSLVVVPDQGGNPGPPLKCTDHSSDVIVPNQGNALANNAFNFTTGVGAGPCAWAARVVVPLKFAPVPSGCPFRNDVFSVAGSPMMADAMAQWQTALCAGKNGLTFSYDNQSGEPLAVQEAVNGVADVALTTLPASADSISTGTKHFVYAPIAVSAASVAYWLDNNTTGQQLSGLKLDTRLLVKLLTTSYNPGISCTTSPKPSECDAGVDKNPFYIFNDPEFKQLNPNIVKAETFFGPGATYLVPTVVSGNSDLTWTVTRWIAADKDAMAFLKGSYDPWGMHVNSFYLNAPYPTNQFAAQDPKGEYSRLYLPVFPLEKVVTFQALGQDAGSNTPTCTGPNHCPDAQDPAQPVGIRRVMAIVGESDAALDHFPVAALKNAAGKFVRPTDTTMAAALKHMISDGDGTLQMNLTDKKTKNAYPLTMVIYAMAPTSGLSHAKAAAIAKFIDFAAGPGQTRGLLPGKLPPGYLPLPASLRAQARKDAAEVLKQTGNSKSGTPNPGLGSTPSPGASPSPGGSVSLPAVGPSSGPGASGITLLAAHPKPSAFTRFTLPLLLIFGGLMAVSGSAAIAGSVEGGLGAGIRRLGNNVKTQSQAAFSLLRGNRQPSARSTRNPLTRWRNKP
jgi:ABC-type phosphate transport system substrate-binding protein